ncbi:MAG TPA: cytochrome P450 [Allosphingosinicella sp.]|nr:cytochrome P450 [Allosphingosinicella sp.]
MFDPFDPAFIADRYATYRRFRSESPVTRQPLGETHLSILWRYDDAAAMLKGRSTRIRPAGEAVPPHLGSGAAATMFENVLVLTDSPNHDRLRRLVNPFFTGRALEPLRALVRRTVDELVEDLAGQATVDIVARFAARLPCIVVLTMMGVPRDDWDELIRRVPDFRPVFSPIPVQPESARRCEEACQYFIDYFGGFIDRRTLAPGDTMADGLIGAHSDGDRLSRNELIAMLYSFLDAGYESTMSTLANAIVGLAIHRDQLEVLLQRPDAAATAVEEALRWDAPIHFLRRTVAEPVEIHGVRIEPSDILLISIASANRDESRFDQADRFDLGRGEGDHLSFGGGPHYCLGHQLSRMELTYAVPALFKAFPDLRLVDELHEREEHFVFPARKRVDVHLGLK